jgi:primosomal protein N' (replication factor Y)
LFYQNDIVRVLLPIAVGDGYDYRLTADGEIGAIVLTTLAGRKITGVIAGPGVSDLTADKIKTATPTEYKISEKYLDWIYKMADWTMMPIGNVLRLVLNVPDVFLPPKTETLYEFVHGEKTKMTNARQAVADGFAGNDNSPMTTDDIKNISGVSQSVINTMIKNAILVPTEVRPVRDEIIKYADTKKIKLNIEQSAAARAIELDKFSVFLLDGITGSGKTQVYFDAVMRAYDGGRSALIMMPEIALTAQFMSRFADRFGAPPVIWHSNLTAARRREIWRGVARGDIKIIIGTRSALFLPWTDLGLIVVDEEHDSSYKQEDMGNYHARDMAVLRAGMENFPIILASATPSAETINNVNLGKYQRLQLRSRFSGASLPTTKTIDLRTDKPESYEFNNATQRGNLSPSLCDELRATLDAGHQAMLFINRRGYAPIVGCKNCGWFADCPDCSVGMTHHRSNNSLLCHICGRHTPMPKKCPVCGNTDLNMSGIGIEKIAEEVSVKFPNARVQLVSSDTMMSRQAIERLIKKMDTGDIDILIGTQILAKGHHFPNLTLVGVVDSDAGLYSTDFRAGEKTFQQLFQVAGRAGRESKPGRVLLQTFNPDNPVFRALCELNRDDFMATDLMARKTAQMPPFGELVALVIEGEKESALKKFCDELRAAAPVADGVKIMGPITAPMYRVRRWYRMRFLVRGGVRMALQPVVKTWLGRVKVPSNIRIKIDVNPQNFM